MQTGTTNTATDTTETTNNPLPTLTDLIAAHRAEVQRKTMLDALQAVATNAARYEDFQQRLANVLPADLFAALHLTFRWNGDIWGAHAGYPEAAFTFLDAEWTIDNCGDWRIHGPDIYRERVYSKDIPETLMCALADYQEAKQPLPDENAAMRPMVALVARGCVDEATTGFPEFIVALDGDDSVSEMANAESLIEQARAFVAAHPATATDTTGEAESAGGDDE